MLFQVHSPFERAIRQDVGHAIHDLLRDLKLIYRDKQFDVLVEDLSGCL